VTSAEPRVPLPAVEPTRTADDDPFWAAAAEGRLVLPRCRACSTYIWYPRATCPRCHATDAEWVPGSGRATVYSYTVNTRAFGPWADRTPYVIAYVELEEGPRVLTNIVGTDPGSVHIGQAVAAAFEPAGSTQVLRFTPA
jgi:uncharacterized OB-fold protein